MKQDFGAGTGRAWLNFHLDTLHTVNGILNTSHDSGTMHSALAQARMRTTLSRRIIVSNTDSFISFRHFSTSLAVGFSIRPPPRENTRG